MAVRGRKPMPTHLKLVTGNRGRRPVNPNEPVPSAEKCPLPPPHLIGEARAEWDRKAPELYSSGLLSEVDGTALAIYCQLWGRWVEAELALAAHRAFAIANGDINSGFLTSTPNGASMQHALVGVANVAARDLMKYCAEFGMTPSARARVQAAPKKQKADPSAKYLD